MDEKDNWRRKRVIVREDRRMERKSENENGGERKKKKKGRDGSLTLPRLREASTKRDLRGLAVASISCSRHGSTEEARAYGTGITV
jgi:hypothetical protein